MLAQVAHFRTIFRWAVELRTHNGFIVQRNAVVPGTSQAFFGVEVLLLVRGITPLGSGTHAVAFYCFHQDYRGLVRGGTGPGKSRIDLFGILPATLDLFQLLVGEGVHHSLQFTVAIYPVLTLLIARHDGIALVIAIQALFHALAQNALVILCQQAIPAAPPDDLDHIPVGTAEGAFQLLYDFAVAPHWPIQALQVAVHHQH